VVALALLAAIGVGLALVAGLWLLAPVEEPEGEDHPPGRPLPTREGPWVASKGEQRIANWLTREGIAYVYEPTVAGGLTPDFRLEGTDVLIEYWGMAGQASYEDRMAEKMEIYEEHGYDVIGLFPVHVDEMGDVLDRELTDRGLRER